MRPLLMGEKIALACEAVKLVFILCVFAGVGALLGL